MSKLANHAIVSRSVVLPFRKEVSYDTSHFVPSEKA